MEVFGVVVLIVVMGIAGRRPNKASYALIAVAAIGASVYEYLK